MATVELKALFSKLNPLATRCLEAAAGFCVSRAHYEVTVEHLLLKMLELEESDLPAILEHFEVDTTLLERNLQRTVDGLRSGNAGKPVFSPLLVECVKSAWLTASINLQQRAIRSGSLLLTVAENSGRFLTEDQPELTKVSGEQLTSNFFEITAGSSEELSAASAPASVVPGTAVTADSALGKYAINLTEQARSGSIDPIFGRDVEIRQMVDILARRRKNNPIVVGEAGVGKTAVVEGLALRIANGDVPDLLKDTVIFNLDLGLLQAGASVKGEFENRLKSVIQEIKESVVPTITFIDEVHTLIGAGGSAGTGDAANLLKPALARGEFRTIAATTWAEYKKHIEEDPALARRFQAVKLDEPSVETTSVMLRGLKFKYEEAHGVHISDAAVAAAARLSGRYIAGRQLPDKAVDLLDTSAARVKIGLSCRPGALEDLERTIQSLEREGRALRDDQEYGLEVDTKRLKSIDSDLAETRQRLQTAEEAWLRVKAASDRVLELRSQLDELEGDPSEVAAANSEATDAPTEEELKQQLQEARAALIPGADEDSMLRTEVDPTTVAEVVGDWTGIPVGKMVGDAANEILGLEEQLCSRLLGQDHALAKIAQTMRSAKAGLQDPNKPMGIFLLAGPSGVGKTETALAVADLIYGGERFVTSINMSEFQDREMGISALVGAKPGYVGYGKGGVLTEAVRQRPYSVVLLDEVEKACQEVRNLFFQVFDKGVLTDGTGRTIDFRNTVIFITTNLASQEIQELCAASPTPDPEGVLNVIRPLLSQALQPAWLARTSVIPYLSLGEEALRSIAALKLDKVVRRIADAHDVALRYGDDVVALITERCAEVETGARNIDHILEGTLLPQLSVALLEQLAVGELPERLGLSVDDEGAFQMEWRNG